MNNYNSSSEQTALLQLVDILRAQLTSALRELDSLIALLFSHRHSIDVARMERDDIARQCNALSEELRLVLSEYNNLSLQNQRIPELEDQLEHLDEEFSEVAIELHQSLIQNEELNIRHLDLVEDYQELENENDRLELEIRRL